MDVKNKTGNIMENSDKKIWQKKVINIYLLLKIRILIIIYMNLFISALICFMEIFT